jgi:hypothetical protein
MNLHARVDRIERSLPAPVPIVTVSWTQRVQKVVDLIDELLVELDGGRLVFMAGLTGVPALMPRWGLPDRYPTLLLCYAFNRASAKLQADGHATPTTLADLHEWLVDARQEALAILAAGSKKCQRTRT